MTIGAQLLAFEITRWKFIAGTRGVIHVTGHREPSVQSF
jgi:hypothetical protein